MSAQPEMTVESVLAEDLVRCVYQPIVELASGTVVACEALARGPAGSPLERPDHLFAAAREAGRLADLDWACRAAAVTGAIDAGLDPALALFVNVEPETIGTPAPQPALHAFAQAGERLRVVLEITERRLLEQPAELMRAIAAARERGWGIALDDVGANPDSLALLPFVRPDVVKLDMRLVQARPSSEIGAIIGSVLAYAERTGAVVLAEGIETAEQAERAATYGATFGQGWHFGRPDPSPPRSTALPRPIAFLARPAVPELSPFDSARRAGARTRVGRKHLLFALSRYLEEQALRQPGAPVVVAAFQDASRFTAATTTRYGELAARCSLVGALAAGLPVEPTTGVRGGHIPADDPLHGEWTVAVVGAGFVGALIARDLGDHGPEPERRFEFTLTHDPDLVVLAGESLLRRIVDTS